MRKALRTSLMILVLAAPAYAGDIPFGVAPPPPPPAAKFAEAPMGAPDAPETTETTEPQPGLLAEPLLLLLPGV